MNGEKGTIDGLSVRFCLRDDIRIEDFGDRSLVLLCDSMLLREINRQTRQLLALLDGRRTLRDIALETAPACAASNSEILAHIEEAFAHMEQQGIVRRIVTLKTERTGDMKETKYLVNPDVSFRPEEDEGGILFNADTDALEVINPTAAEIWAYLAAPHTQADVVGHLCEVCDGAPRDDVEKDVSEFLENLVAKGFIGIVEKPA